MIGNLLAQNDDGLDWLNSDISTDIKKEKSAEIVDEKEEKSSENESSEEVAADVPIIYHSDYKDMIDTLPTDICKIKQQLVDLLELWQQKVAAKDDDLSAEQIKSGFNALNFYISKILKKPFLSQFRSINTYNKQYKERLSSLPKIETLLTLIGYEKNKVFWVLPLLCKENEDDKEKEAMHERQIEFLKAFKEVLANLFNLDGNLPFGLTEKIMKIKEERGVGNNKENTETQNMNVNVDAIGSDKGSDEKNKDKESVPETKYSNKFMEIAEIVAAGKKPDDVQVIDDMPPDPNAEPSPSKIEQKIKPFEQNQEIENEQNGMNWFDQYEAQQQKEENGNDNEASNSISNDDA